MGVASLVPAYYSCFCFRFGLGGDLGFWKDKEKVRAAGGFQYTIWSRKLRLRSKWDATIFLLFSLLSRTTM